MRNSAPTFGINEAGRDFVVGDVHGCFRTLERALGALEFDPEGDRLFGVGALVNRGPHSVEAIDWLERRFEAVTMGNHDRFVLSWLQANPRPSPSAQAEWLTDVPRREFPRWRAVLAGMPIALTIQTPHGAVGVVHADPFCTQVEPVQEEGEGCRRVGLCVLAFPFGMSSYGLDSNRSSVLNAW